MKISLLISISFLFSFSQSFSQISCGTDKQHNFLLNNSIDYKKLVNSRKELNVNNSPLSIAANNPDTIPIVVHVINLGSVLGSYDNPSDASIQSMINDLNLWYSGSYADPWGLNQSVGVDVDLFFKLAQRTPDCQPTNGILRVNGSSNNTYVNYGVSVDGYPGISQQDLTNFSYWDNTRYLNIWLINKVGNGAYGGYAYYPTGSNTIYDGAMLEYGQALNTNLLAHEIGHNFFLYHTFYGSNGSICPNNSSCSQNGDQVCDTDPILINTNGCTSTNINPCTSIQFGNSVYNHMSYSCAAIFTNGQKNRMRNALTTYRSSLLISDGELPPPCNILPIKLLPLTITKLDCSSIKLNWSTEQELSNNGFLIENSVDGNNFFKVAFIKCRGNTKSLENYDYIIPMLTQGKFYYRIKQIDFDGKFQYSNTLSTEISCSSNVYKIYPNPVSKILTLRTNSTQKNNISLCNIYGQQIMRYLNTNIKNFDIRNFPVGTYFLIINDSIRLKFLKN